MRRLPVLVTLSGARPELLDRCPTERAKFQGIGGAVLTTSVLATVSMWFALYSALGVNAFLAVPAALAWGLAILSLDRWLVSTIPADGPRRWRLAVPRVAMAVLLGFVISTPLVLQIFRSEIDAQIVEIKQRRADEFAGEQRKGAVGQEVVKRRKAVTDLQNVINSQGDVPLDPSNDPRIRALTGQRADQQQQMQRFYNEWQCQLYGGRNCPRKGDGPLAAASKANYDKAKDRVDQINGQIESRKKELTAGSESAKRTRLDQARDALPAAQRQLEAAERQRDRLEDAFVAENEAANGLLIRLEALNEVSGKDFTLNGARFLLFLLFLLIECLPVGVKLLQKAGNYERILALEIKREYQLARQGIAPGPGLLFGDDRPATVRAIWDEGPVAAPGPESRPEPPLSHAEPYSGGYAGPAAYPAPPAADPDATGRTEQTSMEDEAIRGMLDTRVNRTVDAAVERSDGRPLYTDDDDY